MKHIKKFNEEHFMSWEYTKKYSFKDVMSAVDKLESQFATKEEFEEIKSKIRSSLVGSRIAGDLGPG